jgi:hypothetical protein
MFHFVHDFSDLDPRQPEISAAMPAAKIGLFD